MSNFKKYMNLINESSEAELTDDKIKKIVEMFGWNSPTAYEMAFSFLPNPENQKNKVNELLKNEKLKKAIIALNSHSAHSHSKSEKNKEISDDELFKIYMKMYKSYGPRD